MPARKPERGIYQKIEGSNVWYIRWSDASGKLRREKAGTLATARTLLTVRRNESQVQRKLPTLSRRRVTFDEIAADMLEHSKRHNGADTFYNNLLRVKKLMAEFGKRPADGIQRQHIEDWLADNTQTPATSNRYHATFSLIFRLALHNGRIAQNPMQTIRKRREDNGRLRFLDSHEESKLRGFIMEHWPHHWPAVELALNTGMRQGEQFSLKWEQVDFARRQIALHTTKNGKPRYLPLNDAALAALNTLHSLANGQPWVFLNRYGEHHTSPRTWFDKATAKLRLTDATWHTLRHTFASRLAMAGANIVAIKELMGHTTLQMTMRYAHLTPEHNLSAVQLLCNTSHNATDPRTDPKPKRVRATEARAVN